MTRLACLLLSALMAMPALAGEPSAGEAKEKTWWEKRQQRTDIFYPHDIHQPVMEADGDACLRCHPFTPIRERDPERLRRLTVIANEPLRAICHQCHVDRPSAPWRCSLCHDDPRSIWPPSHEHQYAAHHAEDARADQAGCRACHLDLSFCSDCHFRRDASLHLVHPLGWLSAHGMEARFDTAGCGRCHNAGYCSDCHRRRP